MKNASSSAQVEAAFQEVINDLEGVRVEVCYPAAEFTEDLYRIITEGTEGKV